MCLRGTGAYSSYRNKFVLRGSLDIEYPVSCAQRFPGLEFPDLAEVLASNLPLRKLSLRNPCVDCRVVDTRGAFTLWMFARPMGSSERERMRPLCLLGGKKYKREREKTTRIYKREKQ